MELTYVGEWIEYPSRYATEKRMVADLTYIYENPDQFNDWITLYNDGCDIYCCKTGKGRLELIEDMTELVNNG